MARKSKLIQAIEERLTNPMLVAAWNITDIEIRKSDYHVFRLPTGVLFDELYAVIGEECVERGIKHKRAGKWATVAELSEVLSSVHWLWKKWIPIGLLTLLVGEPGGGKSMIAIDFVKTVTNGGSFPMTEVKRNEGNAAWVETESSQQLINDRTQSMSVNRDRIYLPSFGGDMLGQPDLMDEIDKQRLVNLIQDIKPQLVVIDSLGGAHTRGENKIEEVRPMLDFLAKTARDNDVAILAIHHLRKRANGEDIAVSLDRVRGSSAFSAFARSIIALDKSAAGDLTLKVLKSNVSAIPDPVSLSITFQGEHPTGICYKDYKAPDPKRTKKEKCSDWVFSELKQNGKMQLLDIVSAGIAQGYTRGNIYDARDNLGDSIVISGDGRNAFWELMTNPFNNSNSDEQGDD